ncbi:MAG: hypothetical protein MUC73_00365 [Cyclobacteriaceae bacterium]|jgi:hypothetical protein|nr:hypothetical protein [Cyclobacteriaceae bacterium]
MARELFQEYQTLRSVVWMWWIIIPVSIVMIIFLFYGFYWQLIMGEPWGTKPGSDAELILTIVLVLVTWGVVMLILLSMNLQVHVTKTAIRYRLKPFMRKSEEINCDEIQAFRILKLSFLKSRRRGIRRNLSGNEKLIHISGRHALELLLNDGRKLVIGTQRPKELESAMKEMKSPCEPA